MKKALLFSPYLDILGGGEYYLFSLASLLLKLGFIVNLAWKDKSFIDSAATRFNLDLNKVILDKKGYSLLSCRGNILKKFTYQKQFDLFFFLSDGSIPLMMSKRNILHFQVPFKNLKTNFFDKIKLKKIHYIVVNSIFTKKTIDNSLGINSKVIYPPVNISNIKVKLSEKKNVILSVGRFDAILNNKKQDLMLNVFKEMVDGGLKGWQLFLAGGAKESSQQVKRLIKLVGSYPVKIKVNLNRQKLLKLYREAKIYWHAAGFGIDENEEPAKTEHLGISIIEAMGHSCVPIVVNKGGAGEIITSGENGFLWEKKDELKRLTLDLIENERLYLRLASQVKRDLSKFYLEEFNARFKKITG